MPRLAIFCSTYRFAPCTMVITVISVATPIVSPSIVSDARSLCARRAAKHNDKLSRTASISAERIPRCTTDSRQARTQHSKYGRFRTHQNLRGSLYETTLKGVRELHGPMFIQRSIVNL